jgi:S-adenosylmethionine:tRNA ribosyltransferase-isomerase
MAAISPEQPADGSPDAAPLRLSDYDYELPPERIAQTPATPRDAARLLALRCADGAITHHGFRDLPDLLGPDDLLVVNETRVTAVRLWGTRGHGGPAVEALLLRPAAPDGHGSGSDAWEALVRPGRKVREGDTLVFGEAGLAAEVLARTPDGGRVLRFRAADDGHEGDAGAVSLADGERYQTVYAKTPGSAAAPTAGLHFTPELLDRLRHKGITVAAVRLDVGLGTFRPIRTEDVDAHEMHAEAFEVPEETARAVNACRGRVVAVGTTTLRALESAALEAENGTAAGRVCAARGETRLFIRPAGGGHPGHRFRAVDALITNFHQPHSTLLLLVAAFAGRTTSASAGREHLRRAYATALAEGYRFLSFGDAMLLH